MVYSECFHPECQSVKITTIARQFIYVINLKMTVILNNLCSIVSRWITALKDIIVNCC